MTANTTEGKGRESLEKLVSDLLVVVRRGDPKDGLEFALLLREVLSSAALKFWLDDDYDRAYRLLAKAITSRRTQIHYRKKRQEKSQ